MSLKPGGKTTGTVFMFTDVECDKPAELFGLVITEGILVLGMGVKI